ncbi:MAG: phosphate acyltransferase, partial [Burkholderiaceae bacterium]
ERFIYQTGILMQPVFNAAKVAKPANKRIAIAEGEEERALRACQQAMDEDLAVPILVGRPAVIEARIKKAGLRMQIGKDVEVVNPEDDPRYRTYWERYHTLMGRQGVSPENAKVAVRRSNTLIAALMVSLGDADGMLCGLVGNFEGHLRQISDVLGKAKGASTFATCNALVLSERTLFIADTYVNEDPTAQQLAEIAAMTVAEVQRFGIPPKVAFLSHSSFGSSSSASAKKMRLARDLFAAANPDVECDGEMHGDAAMSDDIRKAYLPGSTLHGSANVLICPNLDSANILFNVLKMTSSEGVTVGPVLLGSSAPVHILNPSSTVRRYVNMIALAAANAGAGKA